VFSARYALDPATVVLFSTALVNAWLLSFFVQSVNGLLAFWITQATAMFDVWFGL